MMNRKRAPTTVFIKPTIKPFLNNVYYILLTISSSNKFRKTKIFQHFYKEIFRMLVCRIPNKLIIHPNC